jgi:hypothetical protein
MINVQKGLNDKMVIDWLNLGVLGGGSLWSRFSRKHTP